MKKNVLVAGGLGFLGANVVEEFKARDYKVEVCSRSTGVDIRNFDQINDCLAKLKPGIIINCAAHVGGIAYNAKCPVAIYEDNLLVGFNLLKAAVQNNVGKFVNIMPNCTYPGTKDIYREGEWWDGPMHPTVLTYGMPRKALWVQSCSYCLEHGFKSIHLVLPNLYGPRDHFDIIRSHALGALVKKVVEAKLNNKPSVEIWGTGTPIREWMYVEDAAKGIVIATEKYDQMDILNLACQKGYSIKEIAEAIRAEVKWSGEFVYQTDKPDGAPKKILDMTNMKKHLGWMPKTSLPEGIKKTIQWYLDNRERIK
ncbi:NAD-dependent epimerase/dehydratase family protein [Candidatus Margulisiibacteriota bacterium]